ncbi:MAG: hypothetical protein DMG80_12005 [Acidobacteria bacterium]|nr:MAG: hypothetical protein DMG80_12005 [Acidobacteriota bacterium]
MNIGDMLLRLLKNEQPEFEVSERGGFFIARRRGFPGRVFSRHSPDRAIGSARTMRDFFRHPPFIIQGGVRERRSWSALHGENGR